MKIRFIKEYSPKDGSGTVYKVGQECNFTVASANHFITRGAAVEISAPKRAKKPSVNRKPQFSNRSPSEQDPTTSEVLNKDEGRAE